MAVSKYKGIFRDRQKPSRGSLRKKAVRKRVTRRPPEDMVILLAFRIENGAVNLISPEGENVPLFPARRLSGYNTNESLRRRVVRAMKDA